MTEHEEKVLKSGSEVAVGIGEDEESPSVDIPGTLPVLPLKNTVLFPFLLHPLLVNTELSKKLIDAVLVSPQRLMMSVAVRRPIEGSPASTDLYRAGTVLRIVKMIKGRGTGEGRGVHR